VPAFCNAAIGEDMWNHSALGSTNINHKLQILVEGERVRGARSYTELLQHDFWKGSLHDWALAILHEVATLRQRYSIAMFCPQHNLLSASSGGTPPEMREWTGGSRVEITDFRHPLLPGPRSERAGGCSDAEQRDELAPVGAGELSASVPAMLAVPVRRQSSREHQTSV
jgi:hypothetical protein